MRVINNNLSNPDLTVEMIAAEVGLSRVHLHRKLKELTNQTTRTFIRNVCLQQAANILMEGKQSITEVAQRTGFSSIISFSQAFKEQYGMSPTAYTATHLKQEKEETE